MLPGDDEIPVLQRQSGLGRIGIHILDRTGDDICVVEENIPSAARPCWLIRAEALSAELLGRAAFEVADNFLDLPLVPQDHGVHVIRHNGTGQNAKIRLGTSHSESPANSRHLFPGKPHWRIRKDFPGPTAAIAIMRRRGYRSPGAASGSTASDMK